MEIVLKTDSEEDVEQILALARKLNITVEDRGEARKSILDKEVLKKRILNFKAKGPTSFGDAADWEREQREDRNLSLPVS